MTVSQKHRRAHALREQAWQNHAALRNRCPLDLPGLIQFVQAAVTHQSNMWGRGWPHTIVAETPDGELCALISPDGNPPDVSARATIQDKLAERGCIRCVEVHEVWLARTPQGCGLPELTPEQNPDRTEAIAVFARDLAGTKMYALARIERGGLQPWGGIVTETEHGVGLLGIAIDATVERPRTAALRAHLDALRKLPRH